MSKQILLPELAESVVEGEIVQWLVAEGNLISEDQPLVEVMTDKVTVELPSPYAGVLEKQLVKEGDIVPVETPIALIGSGETKSNPDPAATTAPAKPEPQAPADDGSERSLFKPDAGAQDEPLISVKRPSDSGQSSKTSPATVNKVTGPYGRVLAVPAARRLARDLDIDINEVAGSGPNGRVRVDDVRRHSEDTAPSPAQAPIRALRSSAQDERIPVRGLRRAISKQMVASHLNTVRTLHVDEADVSALVALRTKLKPVAEKRGVKLSYLPIIMKAVVTALKAFPIINAALDEDAGEIVIKKSYNLGLAVATEAGLVVPVVQSVDTKSLLEVAAEVDRLAGKAREGKLEPADIKSGTFSITNIGSLGGLFSFPIINAPEAAILGVHSIKKRPVVLKNDSVVARQMLYLSLSFDHRIIDGAEAAQFTSYLIELLETPETLMLDA